MKMPHKIRLLILLISTSLYLSCNSKDGKAALEKGSTLPDSDSKILKGLVDDFFVKYKSEGGRKAVDYIFSSTKSVNGIENLKTKLDSVSPQIGAFTGYTRIAQKSIGDGMVLLSYLVKHKNDPLRFTFIYYKPEDHWMLYKFYFDTDLVEELEYSGKLYFINEGMESY